MEDLGIPIILSTARSRLKLLFCRVFGIWIYVSSCCLLLHELGRHLTLTAVVVRHPQMTMALRGPCRRRLAILRIFASLILVRPFKALCSVCYSVPYETYVLYFGRAAKNHFEGTIVTEIGSLEALQHIDIGKLHRCFQDSSEQRRHVLTNWPIFDIRG